MPVLFFCPRWGSEELPWEVFCNKVRRAGYSGFEYGVACTATEKELDAVWTIAERSRLEIIVQHYDTCEPDFSKHYDQYCAWLEKVKPYPCVKMNSQTGKDFFTFEQNKALIEAALAVSLETGIPVLHETHRNTFSFAAHITKAYLQKIPELEITLDASHWVCVAESYLEDQAEALHLAIEHTGHIHARVGYPEGPQVPDPRVSEWEPALDRHLDWWDRVIMRKKKAGELITITPEFGPSPYMVHWPGTGTPVCDQWNVNVFMMDLLKNRYSGGLDNYKKQSSLIKNRI